jgi:excinuclease ABC subunit C
MPRARIPFDRENLKTYPTQPGVYFMKSVQGEILYVGKAKNLRNRLRSYFQKPSKLQPKVFDMMRQVTAIETQVVGSELEALLLEARLIKAHQPFFNRKVKHYQHLLFLQVTDHKQAPCLQISLETDNPNSTYYGPFSSRSDLEMKRDIINRVFKLRSCNDQQFVQHFQNPCSQYQIGLCAGPCSDEITDVEYLAMVQDFLNYMNGDPCHTIELLVTKREAYSDAMQFEKAANVHLALEELEALQLQHYERLQTIEAHHCILVLPGTEPEAFRLLAVLHGLPYEWQTFDLKQPNWAILSKWVEHWLKQKEIGKPTSIPKELYEEARLISSWLQQTPHPDGWVIYLEQQDNQSIIDALRCVFLEEHTVLTIETEWE